MGGTVGLEHFLATVFTLPCGKPVISVFYFMSNDEVCHRCHLLFHGIFFVVFGHGDLAEGQCDEC